MGSSHSQLETSINLDHGTPSGFVTLTVQPVVSQNGKVEMASGERTLLGFFLAKMHKVDPDVLVVSRSDPDEDAALEFSCVELSLRRTHPCSKVMGVCLCVGSRHLRLWFGSSSAEDQRVQGPSLVQDGPPEEGQHAQVRGRNQTPFNQRVSEAHGSWLCLSSCARVVSCCQGRGAFAEKSATCGRLVCDVEISAKELIRCKSYHLAELAAQVLKVERVTVPQEEIRNLFRWAPALVGLKILHSFQRWIEGSVPNLQWLSSPALPAGADVDRRQADPADHVWAERAAARPADHQHRRQRHGDSQPRSKHQRPQCCCSCSVCLKWNKLFICLHQTNVLVKHFKYLHFLLQRRHRSSGNNPAF